MINKKIKYILLSAFFPITAISQKRPNIIIIYADDMGYGDISCQNPDSKIFTPNIDNMACNGMRFTDAHSSSAISSPSRYALLTGSYHWRRMHGIVNSFEPSVFKPSDITLPAVLKKTGYNTACIGKWHLGWDWDSIKKPGAKVQKVKVDKKGTRIVPNTYKNAREVKYWPPSAFDWDKPISGGPIDRGFDYYFGDGTINFPPYAWIENDKFVTKPTADFDLNGQKTMEGLWEFRAGPMTPGWNPYNVLPTLTRKATEYIEKQDAKTPFFLYFALPSPHAPILPTEEYRGKSHAGGYGDYVYQTDAVVGEIIKAIEKKNLTNNTIVIFTADNGPERYAFKRAIKYGHFSTGELRGIKRDLWEGGHRIPFIIKWPREIQKNTVCNEVISQVDLMATLVSIAGGKLPKNSAPDSYDISCLWRKEKQTPLREATVQNTKAGKYAIRRGKWIYIDNTTGEHTRMPKQYQELRGYTSFSTPGLLFDLSTDREQRINLYEKYPEIVTEMKELLKKYLNSKRTAPAILTQ